jgi:tetratricopeptide (TPR) repeat protein
MLGRRLLIWIAAVAVLGHLGLAWILFPHAMFGKYPDIAAALASHSENQLPSDASPLYLLLHLWTFPLFVRIVAMVAGAASSLATGDLAARISGSRFAGAIAGFSAGLAGPWILYEATLEPDALLASLALLSVWAFVAGRTKTAAGFAGVAAALRPTCLVLLLVLAVAAWLKHSRRTTLIFAGVAAVAFAAPVFLVRLRLGGALASTMSAGQALAQGNAPESTGGPNLLAIPKSLEAQALQSHVAGGDMQHATYRQVAQASSGHPLTPGEAERFWAKKAIAYARLHPVAWLRLELAKVRLLFGPLESHDIAELTIASARPAPLLPALVLYPLGCAGLLGLAFRRRFLVPIIAAALAMPHVLFMVDARYRVVLAPLCCVGVGTLAALAADVLRTRRHWGALTAAVFGALILGWPTATHRAEARAARKGLRATEAYQAGDALRRRGDLVGATRDIQLALTLQPLGVEAMDLRGIPWNDAQFWTPLLAPYLEKIAHEPSAGLYWDTAVIEEWAGRGDAALDHFRAAARAGYFVAGSDPGYRAGRLLLEQHKFDEALQELDAALDRHPGTLRALVAAEVAARKLNRVDRARALRDETDELHDRISAAWARAQALRWAGEPSAALRELASAQDGLPESAFLRWESCLARLDAGDDVAALDDYARAIALLPSFSFPIARIDAPLSALAAAHPDDPALLRRAGEHALRRGNLAEAARWLRASLDHDSALRDDREFMAHLFYAERAAHK